MEYNEHGHEIPDATPVAVPIRFTQPSHFSQIREMIRRELSIQAQSQGFETFEEANDFAVGDDFDPNSPYEEQFDPETGVSNFDYQPPPPMEQAKPADPPEGNETPPDQEA